MEETLSTLEKMLIAQSFKNLNDAYSHYKKEKGEKRKKENKERYFDLFTDILLPSMEKALQEAVAQQITEQIIRGTPKKTITVKL